MQEFVNRSDLACGSTIGPITAAGLAIRGVDVGSAKLSMHAIQEQAGARDVRWMNRHHDARSAILNPLSRFHFYKGFSNFDLWKVTKTNSILT